MAREPPEHGATLHNVSLQCFNPHISEIRQASFECGPTSSRKSSQDKPLFPGQQRHSQTVQLLTAQPCVSAEATLFLVTCSWHICRLVFLFCRGRAASLLVCHLLTCDSATRSWSDLGDDQETFLWLLQTGGSQLVENYLIAKQNGSLWDRPERNGGAVMLWFKRCRLQDTSWSSALRITHLWFTMQICSFNKWHHWFLKCQSFNIQARTLKCKGEKSKLPQTLTY